MSDDDELLTEAPTLDRARLEALVGARIFEKRTFSKIESFTKYSPQVQR